MISTSFQLITCQLGHTPFTKLAILSPSYGNSLTNPRGSSVPRSAHASASSSPSLPPRLCLRCRTASFDADSAAHVQDSKEAKGLSSRSTAEEKNVPRISCEDLKNWAGVPPFPGFLCCPRWRNFSFIGEQLAMLSCPCEYGLTDAVM
jgi:hypothetical protein